VVGDLTGLPIANASLLDEGTAAAEAMAMCYAAKGKPGKETFFVAADCHPQTDRGGAHAGRGARRQGGGGRRGRVRVRRRRASARSCSTRPPTAAWPTTGRSPTRARGRRARRGGVRPAGARAARAAGRVGRDVAVGNSQRFGVPMGYGGPHAAFFATADEFKRSIPGRIIGVSRDADGRPALRMALQTREQHIRREKATSNVCTAQVLLAVMAGMYAVWHGPEGLRRIAERVHGRAAALKAGLERLGFHVRHEEFFDTVAVDVGAHGQEDVLAAAAERRINLRRLEPGVLAVALDETVGDGDVLDVLACFNGGQPVRRHGRPSSPRRPTRATTSGSRARAPT
jgi:glycine dehydrogenase